MHFCAGMTAEGDNSVLMQKVAKEHLEMFKPHTLLKPDEMDVSNMHHLIYLLKARENLLYNDLRKKLASAVVFTKVANSY